MTASEAKQLNARVQDRRSTQQEVLRARIVLLAAQQWENRDIATELETTPHTVGFGGDGLPMSAWRGWTMRRVPGDRCRWRTATVTQSAHDGDATAEGTNPLECAQHGPPRRACPRAGCSNCGRPTI